MEQEAIERRGLKQLLLEPETLHLEPDVGLVTTILAFKAQMPAQTRETARQVVADRGGAAPAPGGGAQAGRPGGPPA